MSRILIVDDEPSISWGLSRLAQSMGHEVDVAPSAEEGLCLAATKRPDVVILDVRLPGMDGLSAMASFGRATDGARVIVITAFGDLATAVTAINNGAFEYVVKPFDVAEIRPAIERALRFETAKGDAPTSEALNGMAGRTPAMQNVFKKIALAANSDAAVLLVGECGVGKELAATAVHRNGVRRKGPFVVVNLAAIEPEDLEQELFGPAERPADGQLARREGLISQARGGTLFIEDIADLPKSLQMKLLRSLDRDETGARTTRSPFRVICATQHDLRAMVESGAFRHDLFFRLCTFEIALPPLRERRDDIALLAEQFAARLGARAGALADETLVELERRAWYGNVAELQSAIEHALVVAPHGVVMPEHLPAPLPSLRQSFEPVSRAAEQDLAATLSRVARELLANPESSGALYDRFLEQVEPPLLATVMSKCGQRCAPAARVLGLHRTTLRKKLTQYEIEEEAGES